MKDRELRDDPPASRGFRAAAAPRAAALEGVHSRNDPEIAIGARGAARGGRRRAAGRRGLRADGALAPTSSTSTSPSRSSSCTPPGRRRRSSAAIAAAARARAGRLGALQPRLPPPRDAPRRGRDAGRGAAAADPPGTAFVYQGDEIGMANGPGGEPPHRPRRARRRIATRCSGTPSPGGGFSTGERLAAADRSRAAQRRGPARGPRLASASLPAADRACARELARRDRARSTPRRGCSPTRAARTWSRSTSPTQPLAAPVRGEVVLATGLDAADSGPLIGRRSGV